MELYAKPIITTAKDGTVKIEIRTITPDYIDTRLAELSVFEQINFDIEEVVYAVQDSPSNKAAKTRLKTTLGIGSAEADFLLDLTLEELAYYSQKENREAESKRWEALKAMLATQ